VLPAGRSEPGRATDVNPSAIANAGYNAQMLGFRDRLELRLVPLDRPDAFSVVGESERFDLIVSNPPWEDSEPVSIDEYAFYDSEFRLMRTLVEGLSQHLNPGGQVLLAYGSVSAIKTLQQLAKEHRVEMKILDDRKLDNLPSVFLPGMLLELVRSGNGGSSALIACARGRSIAHEITSPFRGTSFNRDPEEFGHQELPLMQRRAANSGGERETTNRLPAQESARRRGLPVKSPLWHSCFAADPSASRLNRYFAT